MKLFTVILSMALCAISAPALAQTAYDPDRVVKSIEARDLVAIVNSLGDSIDEVQEENRVVLGRTSEGLRYVIFGTACDLQEVSGCQGVMMQVRYDAPDEATIERVNRANINEGAILTWLAEDRSTLAFARYVILDHGVTMANLRENIVVLLAVAPSAMAYAKGEK